MDAYEKATAELRNAMAEYQKLFAQDKRVRRYAMSWYIQDALMEMGPGCAAILAYWEGFIKGTRYQKCKEKGRITT